MIIEIWSDFACPFCFIGKKRFEEALNEFDYKDDVKVIYKSFLLDENAPKETELTALEQLAESKGIGVEEARLMYNNVVNMAKTVGLNYNLYKIIPTSTFDAHRLLKWAETKIDVSNLVNRLYEGYFVNGLNLSDINTLIMIASKVGLDSKEALEILSSNLYTKEVINDIKDAGQLNVRSVPTFIVDRKVGISGAMKKERFLDFLNKSYVKEEKIKIISAEGSCDTDKCDF